jgi:hypothetical protein
MSIIENLDLIQSLLTEEQIMKLEKHARFFDERNKMQFRILGISDHSVRIEVAQKLAPKVFLAAQRELKKVAVSLFGQYLDGLELEIRVGEYREHTQPLPEIPQPQSAVIEERKPENQTKFETDNNEKSIIDNRHLIADFISPSKLKRMEDHALFFADRSQVYFKVVEVKDPDILVTVKQRDVKGGSIIGPKELNTICKSFFEYYLEDKRIHLQSKSLTTLKRMQRSLASIRNELKERGITVEQIADETGLNPVTLKAWLEGRQSMPILAKAMFHYMLKQ